MAVIRNTRRVEGGRRAGLLSSPLRPGKLIMAMLLLLQANLAGGRLNAAPAPLQFDIFLGFDGVVPEASWFPIVFEAKNEGPTFTATVVVEPSTYNQGQKRQMKVELPTGTLKRFVLPVFSGTRGYSSWDIRLLDEERNLRSEQLGVRANKQPASETVVLGSLGRTAGGAPSFRDILPKATELQPAIARLQAPIFPDNPLVLEGMDCLYLNSERAADLNTAQARAISEWVSSGGHLIVAAEQVADIEALPWLKELYPCELSRFHSVAAHSQLQQWVNFARWPGAGGDEVYSGTPFSELRRDAAFEETELQVAVARVREGSILIGADDGPLVVQAARGWGCVTALLFNPEREPFRSWKNAPAFWSKLTGTPPQWYETSDFAQRARWSTDGVFGAMIDSRQIHKLPLGWLLLLLLAYLLVIGPLDQYWLKRIGKPMLTWLTFPAYVILFSGLIYAIGYKLRAGDSEWNELHLVDVLGAGDDALMRGRSFLSIYSPANQKFTLENTHGYAALRGEFAGAFGGQTGNKGTVSQLGDGFTAEVFVPVWSSQLFVSDWLDNGSPPIRASLVQEQNGLQLRLENRAGRNLLDMQLALGGALFNLGVIPSGQTKSFSLDSAAAMPLTPFVQQQSGLFQHAAEYRMRPFGTADSGRLNDVTNSAKAVSFLSLAPGGARNYASGFISPVGLDLSPALRHGTAVLLAWAPDYSPAKKMSRFSPRRSHQDTLWRIAIPVTMKPES